MVVEKKMSKKTRAPFRRASWLSSLNLVDSKSNSVLIPVSGAPAATRHFDRGPGVDGGITRTGLLLLMLYLVELSVLVLLGPSRLSRWW